MPTGLLDGSNSSTKVLTCQACQADKNYNPGPMIEKKKSADDNQLTTAVWKLRPREALHTAASPTAAHTTAHSISCSGFTCC